MGSSLIRNGPGVCRGRPSSSWTCDRGYFCELLSVDVLGLGLVVLEDELSPLDGGIMVLSVVVPVDGAGLADGVVGAVVLVVS
jgi:hypothetical protein